MTTPAVLWWTGSFKVSRPYHFGLSNVLTTSTILQDLPHMPGVSPPPDGITFEAFAEWYTSIGHGFAPWLELLDLNKWFPSDDAARGESGSDGDSSWMGSIPDEEGYYDAMNDMNDSLDATAADDAFGMVGEEETDGEASDGETSDGETSDGDHAGLVVVGHRIHPPPSWPTPSKHPLGCLEYDLSSSNSSNSSNSSSSSLKLYVGPRGCDTLLFFLDVTRLDSLTAADVRAR